MRSASALRPQTHSFNPQAYAEYLQADHFWKERTASGLARAVEHLKRAIAWEPDYAEAYAQLADCYVVMPMISSVPKEFAHTQARQAAERAIALDNSSAEAHLATAEIRLYDDWNFREAEREFKRALELNPKYALAYQWYAEYLSLMSRHGEAIARIQTAQQLDPTSMIVYHQAGQILQSARRYDEALQQYQKALQIQPDFAPTYSAISILYRRERNYPANLEAQREAVRYWEPESSAAAGLKAIADAYSSSGERGFLRATVEFEKKHQGRLYHRAWNYALLGDREQALYPLQQSFEAREIDILGIRNDPEFDSIRSDARFQAIVQRIGFPT
jgi:tetratricopeptide (TPR) repeat protein